MTLSLRCNFERTANQLSKLKESSGKIRKAKFYKQVRIRLPRATAAVERHHSRFFKTEKHETKQNNLKLKSFIEKM